MFFGMKFPIEWAIYELSRKILKIFEKLHFNEEWVLEKPGPPGHLEKFQPIMNLKTVQIWGI